MKISILQIGNLPSKEIKTLCNQYESRLTNYTRLEIISLSEIKNASNLSANELKAKEWKAFEKKINAGSQVILLDENGKNYDSVGFATFIQKNQNTSIKELIFIIGGAFGFSDEAYKRANQKISLSSMTFNHQLVRLIFLEQLYRAFTIIKGEKYHHE